MNVSVKKQREWIKYHIQLTDAERKELLDRISKGKSKAVHITKAHVLLGSDQNSELGRQTAQQPSPIHENRHSQEKTKKTRFELVKEAIVESGRFLHKNELNN